MLYILCLFIDTPPVAPPVGQYIESKSVRECGSDCQ